MENMKIQKMNLVAQKTLFLCERNDIDSITISHVARLAKVSRTWIYKYIGGTKESLLTFAFDHFGNEFALLDSRPDPRTCQEWLQSLQAGFDHFFRICKKNSWALPLYFRFKNADGPIGEKVRRIEQQFIEKSAQEMKNSLRVSHESALKRARMLTAVRLALAYDLLANPTEEKLAETRAFFVDICVKTTSAGM